MVDNSDLPLRDLYHEWHWLRVLGLWVFVIGATLLIIAYFIPNTLPPTPDEDNIAQAWEYRDKIEVARSYIETRVGMIWFGDRFLTGGFLMWLAGCLVDAFRHSENKA